MRASTWVSSVATVLADDDFRLISNEETRDRGDVVRARGLRLGLLGTARTLRDGLDSARIGTRTFGPFTDRARDARA